MSRFYKINNRDEFISFVEKMRGNFDCPEDWEQFFGIRLKTDEEEAKWNFIDNLIEQYRNNIEKLITIKREIIRRNK